MRTVNIDIPTNWIQISNKQLRFISRLFLSDWAQTPYRFLTHAFIKLSNIRIMKSGNYVHVKKKGVDEFVMESWQFRWAASKLQFLLDTITEVRPLKHILLFAKPCDYRLYRTKFIQFLTAENFYLAFQQTKNISHLNNLVATLYLFPWQTFDEEKVKARARIFKLAPLRIKYTVFLWYSGFRWYVGKQCPNIFQTSGSSEPGKVKDHIMGMIRGLTEGDISKNKAIENATTWEALYELNAKAKYIEEMKRKLKKK